MSRIPLLPDFKRPLIFAHRGCSSLAPENTFASFRKARETGSPGIELDIHPTSDGKLAVAHDDTFRRTAPPDANCGGKTLRELGWDEIRRVDVGSFFGREFAKERPPLLEQVLEEFCADAPGKSAMYVDIELKSRLSKGDVLPGLFAEKLSSMGGRVCKMVTVSSFNPVCLGAFKKLWRQAMERDPALPDIPTAVIFCVDDELPWFLRRGFGRFIAGCDYLKPKHDQVSGFSRWRWAALEKRPVVPWTVDDAGLAKKLLDAGCEGIITNKPVIISKEE